MLAGVLALTRVAMALPMPAAMVLVMPLAPLELAMLAAMAVTGSVAGAADFSYPASVNDEGWPEITISCSEIIVSRFGGKSGHNLYMT